MYGGGNYKVHCLNYYKDDNLCDKKNPLTNTAHVKGQYAHCCHTVYIRSLHMKLACGRKGHLVSNTWRFEILNPNLFQIKPCVRNSKFKLSLVYLCFELLGNVRYSR